MKSCARTCKKILCVFLVAMWPCAIAFGQSQSSQQSSSPAQAQPPPKEDSAADAGKKAQKEKPKPKKVYTEEDLSGMRGGGVSVVGDDKPSGSGPGGAKNADGKAGTNGNAGTDVVPMSGQDEAYWRGKARELLDEMAALDQEIAKTKEEIKKYGADGFDATSGLQKNIIYIDNRSSKVQQMEKRKADLGKKLDQLQEDGRKASASPAWFR